MLGLLEKQGYTRVFARTSRGRPRRADARRVQGASAVNGERRAGDDPGPRSLRERRARSRDRSARSRRCASGAAASAIHVLDGGCRERGAAGDAALALLLRPALRRLRHSLPASRRRACSRSIRRSARAKPAAVSAASSASTSASSCRTKRRSLRGGAVRPWQTESYQRMPGRPDALRAQARRAARYAVARAERRSIASGCSKAKAAGKTRSGTACAASSRGSRPRRTRCTSACCCRSIARTRLAPTCDGARLKTDALLWRLGNAAGRDAVLPTRCASARRRAVDRRQLAQLPGISIHELMLLPIERCARILRAAGVAGAAR